MKTPHRIVDAHLHFYDSAKNRHTFLEETDPGYEAFVGNYDALPRRYLLADYLGDTRDHHVEAVVWHEFLSTNAFREAAWAQSLATANGVRHALVGKLTFLAPDLEATLERYAQLPRLTAVREHLVWDEANPLRRFAKRPGLMRDPIWRSRLATLRHYDFPCGLEVFAHQLPDLTDVIRANPNIAFTVALMGWPDDLSAEGFTRWKHAITELAACDNICVDISALECIFGRDWSVKQVAPWVQTTIETIGVSRCMFGSHLPVAKLSMSFADIYSRYAQLTEGYSEAEIDDLFFGVANRWFEPA